MEQTLLLLLLEKFCDVGVLEFLQIEPDPDIAPVFHPLEVKS